MKRPPPLAVCREIRAELMSTHSRYICQDEVTEGVKQTPPESRHLALLATDEKMRKDVLAADVVLQERT